MIGEFVDSRAHLSRLAQLILCPDWCILMQPMGKVCLENKISSEIGVQYFVRRDLFRSVGDATVVREIARHGIKI